MNIKLDSYEQDIEDNFEKHQEIDDPALITLFQKATKAHIDKKIYILKILQKLVSQ
ncbi:hypothetical protein [Rickettsia bellii]|uniref:Uncharacterized protein n=3 Tax=Rickettsia bellii TaxID=33990 RepID=Q1RHK9_RICBR|nr:hypothetical protein [Rickettsia bellii]ABE05155.1 unknown [Rickettsia bellii RML369-C]ABV78778.1 hypothetical protein A1I_01970 [Rickettsia bellii OSU 85-389]KJV89983.1 hypothetical protein RBEAN4_0977 [Rickettsia bellii str. RML An4]KJV91458.1 hypothetical protein RBEMOGI_0060 [Rickettsia bellii str. RML Mogi]